MATAPKGVPREFYEDAVRQRDLALARVVKLDELVATLTRELADLKRHDVAAPARQPFNVETLNPEYGLGGHTVLAIDEVAGGDPQLRSQQLMRAHSLWAAAKAEEPGASMADIDAYVAHTIREGDSG